MHTLVVLSLPEGFATQKIFVRPPKNHKKNHKKSKKIKKSQKISKNLLKFNMGEIVTIKKSSKESESSKFGEKIKKSSYTQGPSCEPLDRSLQSGLCDFK